MDNIDITDSTFSLENFSLGNDNIIQTNVENYYLIYIGLFIIVLFVGFLSYRYYKTSYKQENNGDIDCEGGFCNMN